MAEFSTEVNYLMEQLLDEQERRTVLESEVRALKAQLEGIPRKEPPPSPQPPFSQCINEMMDAFRSQIFRIRTIDDAQAVVHSARRVRLLSTSPAAAFAKAFYRLNAVLQPLIQTHVAANHLTSKLPSAIRVTLLSATMDAVISFDADPKTVVEGHRSSFAWLLSSRRFLASCLTECLRTGLPHSDEEPPQTRTPSPQPRRRHMIPGIQNSQSKSTPAAAETVPPRHQPEMQVLNAVAESPPIIVKAARARGPVASPRTPPPIQAVPITFVDSATTTYEAHDGQRLHIDAGSTPGRVVGQRLDISSEEEDEAWDRLVEHGCEESLPQLKNVPEYSNPHLAPANPQKGALRQIPRGSVTTDLPRRRVAFVSP